MSWAGAIDYTLSVERLRAVLEKLQQTDRVEANAVHNLLVSRDGKCIGFIQIRKHVPDDELLELFDPIPPARNEEG